MQSGFDDLKQSSSDSKQPSTDTKQFSSDLKQISSDLRIPSDLKTVCSDLGLGSVDLRQSPSDTRLVSSDVKSGSVDPKVASGDLKRMSIDDPKSPSADLKVTYSDRKVVSVSSSVDGARRRIKPTNTRLPFNATLEGGVVANSCLQIAFKIYALGLCAVISLLIYVSAAVLTYDPILTKPYDPAAPDVQDMLKSVYLTLKPITTFKQFRYYLLNQPRVSQGFCIGLTSVVCETFLASFPNNMSYQDFVRSAGRFVKDFPPLNRTEVSLWEWQPMTQPFSIVKLHHHFSQDDLKLISACIKAVQKARSVIAFPYKVIDPVKHHKPRFTLASARFLTVGACRLGQIGTFKKRADLLWELCMVGCGATINQDDGNAIDWSTICDVFLFMTPDLRAVHQCPQENEPESSCSAIIVRALEWCGLGLLLEETQFHTSITASTQNTTT